MLPDRDNPSMHLLIPHAGVPSDEARRALEGLSLSHLARLLASSKVTGRLGGDEFAPIPPHELAVARHLGWIDPGQADAAGPLPFAAHEAARSGIDVGAEPWGLITPVHWSVGADQVTLVDPAALQLGDEESRAIFEAVRSLFEPDGWRLRWAGATRWFGSHPSLAGLRLASLDRVIGRSIDPWMPAAPELRAIRRLQSEVQMLLYQHPVNDERETRGALPVNSFWLSGCGVVREARLQGELRIVDDLTAPALSGDWAAWARAWARIDAEVLGPAANSRAAAFDSMTLCGERFALRYEFESRGWIGRLTSAWRTRPVTEVLQSI